MIDLEDEVRVLIPRPGLAEWEIDGVVAFPRVEPDAEDFAAHPWCGLRLLERLRREAERTADSSESTRRGPRT